MIAAPTSEIAIGMKISVFAAVSFLDRSASTARPRPKIVARPATAATHHRLFQMMPRSVENTASSRQITATAMPIDATGWDRSNRDALDVDAPPPLPALRHAT